ncbi:hypothetical protein B7494_g6872 [Chlorociboria aeruginascens]|nr:hypothetical protein B7494_g6872 [Chlorociboria aeruginascens]
MDVGIDPFDGNAYDRVTPMWPCGDPGAASTDYCCESLGRNCCTITTFNYGTSGAAFGAGLDQIMVELASFSAAAATANASQQTSTNNSTLCASKSASTTTVGVAVGVPFGAISVGLLVFILWTQKKNMAMARGHHRAPPDPSKPRSKSNTPLRKMPPQGYQFQNPNYNRHVVYPHPQPQSPPEPHPQIYPPPAGENAFLQRHELGDKTPGTEHSPHSLQQYLSRQPRPFPDLGGAPGIHELI